MKLVKIPMLAVSLLLTACVGSNSVGVRLDPLEAELQQDCLQPWEVPFEDDWEIYAGRIGDELIECRSEKSIVVQAYNNAREIVGPQ
ncbi:hypothetical protein [uncultured Roseobacter sp.]|uniref:hypothetical protein n=1 Tax=uncultured Roseobacter sp. TaxID=114847 RepID=UPI0026222254|nr:hypothetical protein [uncultured Roseobacter sp.]